MNDWKLLKDIIPEGETETFVEAEGLSGKHNTNGYKSAHCSPLLN